MKISHGTIIKDYATWNGYGYANDRMIASLTELGYEVKQNDPTADVQIWFASPDLWTWNPGQYRVGYFAWESTALPPDIIGYLNNVDELWTPSALIADWMSNAGITAPLYVYEHGVDADVWIPVAREVTERFNFLHLGAEAVRKNGRLTMQAFRAAFPNNNDVTLTMKVVANGWGLPNIGRVKIINSKLEETELVKLFHDSHAYVYPSTGEGFGLTPLQGMATGIPTITVPAWAPYRNFLDPDLSLPSRLEDCTYTGGYHPGQVFKIELDDVVDKMRYVVDNYESSVDFAMSAVGPVTERFDWLDLTAQAFGSLERRLEKIV